MDTRKQIERSILGAILLENCFIVVRNILNEKNFSGDEKTIFKAISDMYPKTIDTLTVSHYLNSINQGALLLNILECTQKVNGCMNVVSHCFILLQEDIKDKTIACLQKMYEDQDNDPDPIIGMQNKTWIYGIINDAQLIDIVNNIPIAVEYFKSKKIDCKELEKLAESIPKKAKEIKELNEVKKLFEMIKSIIRYLPIKSKNDCSIMMSCLEQTIVAGLNNTPYHNAIEKLLNEPLTVKL